MMSASFSFDPFPQIETERLLLCRMNKDHALDLLRLRSDDQVMQYIERPRPTRVEDVNLWFEDMDLRISTTESIAWGMVQKTDSKFVGTVGYWRMKKEHFRA